MKRAKRITKFSVETRRTYIFRSRDGLRTSWCTGCNAEMDLATVAGASDVSGLNEMLIYRLIESGAVHFAEDAESRVLVCINSLLAGTQLGKGQ
ncbi:MAG TPA: hypothetical protein VF074_23930 [Pyrinomonadaceae bacterium]